MAVMQTVPPLTNVHCRRAMFYAFDKAGALRALGGPTAGVVAHSMTPPGIEGYEPDYNPYPSGVGRHRRHRQGQGRSCRRAASRTASP